MPGRDLNNPPKTPQPLEDERNSSKEKEKFYQKKRLNGQKHYNTAKKTIAKGSQPLQEKNRDTRGLERGGAWELTLCRTSTV